MWEQKIIKGIRRDRMNRILEVRERVQLRDHNKVVKIDVEEIKKMLFSWKE